MLSVLKGKLIVPVGRSQQTWVEVMGRDLENRDPDDHVKPNSAA